MKKLLGTAAIMVVASGIWVSASLAQSTSGFVLHVTEASYSGCNTIGADESGITCDVIDIEGDGAAPNGQFVFVLAFGFNSTNIPGWGGAADAGIAGAQFGITYDDAAVTVLGWTLCTGGSEIPQDDPISWPAPNTGNAVTWAGGCYDSPSPDDFTSVGFFAITSGAAGLMFIQADPRIGGSGVAVADCETTFYEVDALAAYSSASMNGPDANARKSCSMPVPTQETTWGQLKSSYSD